MSSIALTPMTDSRTVANSAPMPIAKQGSIEACRSGIWAGVFAITMMFAALSSALFVREGSAADWQHIALPRILYLNTLALLLSSYALEMSRRSASAAVSTLRGAICPATGWLWATLFLGSAFFAGQFVAWHRLAARGIFLATDPNSSFFYVLTAMHGIHLFGGLAALTYIAARVGFGRIPLRRSLFDTVALYWHFMGVLWLYLLLIFRIKL
jgi:cytochrome c oxidase subunit 3